MEFLSYLITGISLGSIYAIIALGYTMVYGIAKMLNFAHGDVIMVGAYVSFYVTMFAGNSLRTESELVEFNQFFTKAIEISPALKRSVDMGSNSISNRIKWINRNRPLLNELLG